LIFGFRILRPGLNDENPFHRDAWLECMRNTLNVWIPVAGCAANSTLALVPGSHLWRESDVERTKEAAKINGKQYRTPAVVASRPAFNPVKPNPRYTEALLFSPYMIHGGGANGNDDQTRVSIELRFERKP
jgi:ectoine hydroxylase-related dioxygenase (phytanoyl-CoA dioxygenase family)